MKIELKKLKVHNDMSEETTCFSADVYIDGRLAASAKNDGRGGMTFVMPMHMEGREAVNKAEKWATELPHLTGKDFKYDLPMTLDLYVDMLVHVAAAAKIRANQRAGFITWDIAQAQPHVPTDVYPEFRLWQPHFGKYQSTPIL